MVVRTLVVLLLLWCSAAGAQVISDVTEDGLVRVPSTRKAGVYRLPDAMFAQYRRVMLAPASVAFPKNWDRKNLDRLNTGLKPSERRRIADDMARLFHEELLAELVERGGFTLAEARIIDYEQARETRELQLVNHITEARIAFANAARYTRSALNIAKTERDETISAPP